MNNVIEIEGLSKSYSGNEILKDINLEVKNGSICGLIGRNASGKSVLLKIICGLLKYDSGNIMVLNEKITKGTFPQDVGVVLDCTGFLPHYSGFKNLKMIAAIRKIITDERIRECLRLVGLQDNDRKAVRKYSLGMKQRLAIACAIMENPSLLILDEPMNGLDFEGVEKIRELLMYLNKKENRTILLTSHNKMDIEVLCDYVYSLENGKINLI